MYESIVRQNIKHTRKILIEDMKKMLDHTKQLREKHKR